MLRTPAPHHLQTAVKKLLSCPEQIQPFSLMVVASSLMKKENNNGLLHSPCLSPTGQENSSVVQPASTLTKDIPQYVPVHGIVCFTDIHKSNIQLTFGFCQGLFYHRNQHKCGPQLTVPSWNHSALLPASPYFLPTLQVAYLIHMYSTYSDICLHQVAEDRWIIISSDLKRKRHSPGL